MLYRDFVSIVSLLQSCVEVQNKCRDIVSPYLFDEHNELITTLLKQIYNEHAVIYILNEWLCGNRAPIMFTGNDGVEVAIPLRNKKDLWKAMETYGK